MKSLEQHLKLKPSEIRNERCFTVLMKTILSISSAMKYYEYHYKPSVLIYDYYLF